MNRRMAKLAFALLAAVTMVGQGAPANAHPHISGGAATGQVVVTPTIVAPPACAPTSYTFNSTAIAGVFADIGGLASAAGTVGVTASGNTACENMLTTGVPGATVNVTCNAATGVVVTTNPPSAGVATSVSCSLTGTAVRIGQLVVVTLIGSATVCNATACAVIHFGPTLPLVVVANFVPIPDVPPNLNGPVTAVFAGIFGNVTV